MSYDQLTSIYMYSESLSSHSKTNPHKTGKLSQFVDNTSYQKVTSKDIEACAVSHIQ